MADRKRRANRIDQRAVIKKLNQKVAKVRYVKKKLIEKIDEKSREVTATKAREQRAKDKIAKRTHLTNARIIQKNFSYYYAMVGYPVTEAFLRENKLTKSMGSSLMIISQYSIMKFDEVRNWMPIGSVAGLKRLENRGLIQKVLVQGTILKNRRGWIVTPLGRELIDKYQTYFDAFIEKNKNIHIFNSDERVVVKNGRKIVEQIKG